MTNIQDAPHPEKAPSLAARLTHAARTAPIPPGRRRQPPPRLPIVPAGTATGTGQSPPLRRAVREARGMHRAVRAIIAGRSQRGGDL